MLVLILSLILVFILILVFLAFSFPPDFLLAVPPILPLSHFPILPFSSLAIVIGGRTVSCVFFPPDLLFLPLIGSCHLACTATIKYIDDPANGFHQTLCTRSIAAIEKNNLRQSRFFLLLGTFGGDQDTGLSPQLNRDPANGCSTVKDPKYQEN